MAGKRPRHIQRTTSMSQLGGGAFRFPHGLHKDAGVPVRGHSCPPKQELGHTCMDTCPVSAEMAALPFETEQHVKSMVIDSSAEESLSASRMLWSGPVTVPPDDHRVPMRGPEAVSGSFGAHQWSLPAQPTVKNGEILHFRHGRLDVGGSVRPAHFLDICYLCSKSLGHGRDVFIYRGDRAFCSFECRHLQIMADERREKSSLTGASDGLVTTVQVSDASNANHVETVGAA